MRSLPTDGGQVPGVPIMFIRNRKYTVERLPEAYGDRSNF